MRAEATTSLIATESVRCGGITGARTVLARTWLSLGCYDSMDEVLPPGKLDRLRELAHGSLAARAS